MAPEAELVSPHPVSAHSSQRERLVPKEARVPALAPAFLLVAHKALCHLVPPS